MQLHTTTQRIEQGGVGESTTFSVEIGAKLFKTLTTNLYSDRIRAVIRELSTNAYEAHQLLNKEDVPFSVKLPSNLNTVFSIRDYGPGLSEDEIKTVYTSIFKSTKDNSNEYGGAYGLGSKSPFTYAGSFIVHSYYNGYKYVYFMTIGEDQFPKYTIASKTETTEPNGLEIVIDVRQRDVDEFVSTAKDVFKWFKVHPNVVGNKQYSKQKLSTIISGKKWAFIEQVNEPVAVMANVAYGLNGYTGKHKQIMRSGKLKHLTLNFDIGEVEPAPSRESLTFDPKTIRAIDIAIDSVLNELLTKCEESIANCECYWDAACKAVSYNGLIDISNVTWRGMKLSRNVKFGMLPDGKNILYTYYSVGNRPYLVDSVTINKNIVAVYNDLPRGGASRTIQFVRSKYSISSVYCSGENISLEDFAAQMKMLPSQIILSSTLPPIVKSSGTRTSYADKVLVLRGDGRRITRCWEVVQIDLSTAEGLYVPINNNKIVFGNGRTDHPNVLFKVLKRIGFNQPVYGIRPSLLKKIGPNLKLAFQTIDGEIEKYYNSISHQLAESSMKDKLIASGVKYFINNISCFASQLSSESETNKLYTACKKILQKPTVDTRIIDELESYMNVYSDKKVVRPDIHDMELPIKEYRKKYPVLFHYLDTAVAKDMIYYVKYIEQFNRN